MCLAAGQQPANLEEISREITVDKINALSDKRLERWITRRYKFLRQR